MHIHQDHDDGTRGDARSGGRNRAIVLGAGIAGLLAARALAPTYDVIIVDRDGLPDDLSPRRGAPQGNHAHALLAGGQRALESLLPGFTSELARVGAPVGDVLADTALHFNGHRLRSKRSGLVALSASRPRLEQHVRRRVGGLPSVTFFPRADVTGLIVDAGRVCGVRLMRRADDSTEERLYGDVVVDALGRSSRLPDWMDRAGLEAPREERTSCNARYATSCYPSYDDDLDGILAVVLAPTRARPHGAVLARIEDRRWILTLSGMAGASPPLEPTGFAACARTLGSPEIASIVARPPLGRPASYRFEHSRRRRFEDLRRQPHGLIAIGDSIATFNPVYGQGMSVAAIEAVALQHLTHQPWIDPSRWFRDAARIVNPAWEMATAADATFAASGHPRLRHRIANRYVAAVHDTAAHNADIAEAFVRVSGMVDGPESLMRPRNLVRVIRHVMRRQPDTRRPGRARQPSNSVRGKPTRGPTMTTLRLFVAALLLPVIVLAATFGTVVVAVRFAGRLRGTR